MVWKNRQPPASRWPVLSSFRPLAMSAPCAPASASSVRLAWRALRATSVVPFLWPSSSSSTIIGRKMSCSSKRNRLIGSCISTLVSSTNSLAGPVGLSSCAGLRRRPARRRCARPAAARPARVSMPPASEVPGGTSPPPARGSKSSCACGRSSQRAVGAAPPFFAPPCARNGPARRRLPAGAWRRAWTGREAGAWAVRLADEEGGETKKPPGGPGGFVRV